MIIVCSIFATRIWALKSRDWVDFFQPSLMRISIGVIPTRYLALKTMAALINNVIIWPILRTEIRTLITHDWISVLRSLMMSLLCEF